ncbi:MAG: penicillin-binding protein [Cryomorphaceae bacterium]|nr:MAG: penicillin-binding protein [Cryomorphaceae bacterium]
MTAEKKTNEKKPRRFGKLIALFWLVLLSPFLGLALMLYLASISDLPGFDELENPKSNLATVVLSSDGQVLGRYFRENRVNATYEELSPILVKTLIATEDERFWEHSGVDVRATGRAIVFMGKKGGASTITQQLAKMLFHDRSPNIVKRIFQKFQEWIIAVRLERQFTKEEIITMYLNKFDWVNNAVGIKSAASVYFNSSPDSLNIEQSAMLIGMFKNPRIFNPLRRPDSTLHRRSVVLGQLMRNELINKAEYDSLRLLPLGLDYQRVDHTEGPAPYFREVLRSDLREMLAAKDERGEFIYHKPDGSPFDLYSDGLRIYTTIDSRMQHYAEQAVTAHLGGPSRLQEEFFSDIARWRNPPFSNDLNKEEIDQIMQTAVRRTERYRVLMGKECSICHRRVNIVREPVDGKEHFVCQAADCGHSWRAVPEDSVPIIFEKPTPMRVFSWRGEIDTLMSPMDSIRYYKSFLQAGMVSIEPHTGFVKAWVGGINFRHFMYDHVRVGKRQVGSTFKPFVYATAIREGYSPCHEVVKAPTTFHKGTFGLIKDWTPQDSDREYGFMVSLKWGLANSVNTVTAWVMKQFGPEAVIRLARDLGIESKLEPVPSLALGVADLSVLEITSANATFANKGVHIKPIIITRIEDMNGNAIYDVMPETNEAMDEKTSYVMLNLMKGTIDGVYNETRGRPEGTAIRLRMNVPNRAYDDIRNVPIACKTGTTQNQSDGWFIGLTPDLVTGVWVGAEDRAVRFRTLKLGMGTNMALPIWGYFMKSVYADPSLNISTDDFERPPGDLGVELDCEKYKQQQKGHFGGDSPNW